MSDAQTPFQILLEIDQRCRALAAGLPSQQAAVQTWSGIGFRMGERFFVAPMGEVGEVLHEPRLWPEYHASYFGGFVRDTEGNNVEAVCHSGE